MRLACIGEDGEVVDFEVALQQQPYIIRGLLADALARCQHILPDSLGFLQAEREVREVLRTFHGGNDRYAKGYILSRTLDSRTQKTPRADLILLALRRGGPLALVGLFYATLDAHRNPRHRDTLDYLLNKATDESKLQLITRSGTFPCNPSIISWLVRILEKLRPNAQHLAGILRCLGTSGVPLALFRRLWRPSLSWGRDGEPAESNARTATSMSDEQKFIDALRDLEYVGFIRISPTAIDLDMRIAEFLRVQFEDHRWIAEAARIMAHAFPKYRPLEPTSYVEYCKLLEPPLASVFSYLVNVPIGSLAIDMQCLGQFVEVCLSTSYFRNKKWKYQAVSIATQAVDAINNSSVGDAVLTASVNLRTSFLTLLYQEPTRQISRVVIPELDHRSHALAADLAILNARECVGLHTLELALERLTSFDPSVDGNISTLGAVQEKEVTLMRARTLRFAGRFQEAHTLMETLPRGNRKLPVLASILCEVGRCDEAIEVLTMQVTENPQSRTIYRVRVALAHARLAKCMHNCIGGGPLDWRELQSTRSLFQELLGSIEVISYFGRMDHLSILIGLAVLNHLDGQLDSALTAWQDALTTSQQYLSPGYTDMIIYYSTSELEARRGVTVQADILESQARNLFARTGRQHHFVGLGSLWPDIIGKSLITRGRQPIIPIQDYHQP